MRFTKVRDLLTAETGGKSYKAHKYSLDVAGRSNFDYEIEQIQWKKMAETTKHKDYVDLRSTYKKTTQNCEQIITYFLDGSRRVFKVDDMAYSNGGRSVIYPIIAGQIGIGCCKRINKKLVTEQFEHEIVLSIPDIADADGNSKRGFFPALAKKLSECTDLKRLGVNFGCVLPYSTSKNDDAKFEDKATACVQDRMIKREKEIVAELVKKNKLGQDNYLIKDGSLEYRPTDELRKDSREYKRFKHNYNWVLGVSKSFNSEVCLDMNGKPAPGFIADLPLFHRTPVACYENIDCLGDIQFAVWYIRLREQERTRSPFDGIVKVEKILASEDEIGNGMNSNLVDTLSTYLINERNPVCYGSDMRWANHIYPIYMTEAFVKSRYISTESFLHLF